MKDVTFGTWCDGQAWPELAGGAHAVVGSAIVGPIGLVEAVETALGTRAPVTAPVQRIAAMRTKLAAAGLDGERFWSRSFAADPWSTARLVLSWRDELVLAGWDRRSAGGSSRLADIAAVEVSGPSMPPGYADRCAAAVAALQTAGRLPWRSLSLVEPKELLEPGTGRLIDAIAGTGVPVTEIQPASPSGGDLGRIQRLLAGDAPEALDGDGSVLVIHGDTEISAADALASWLAAGSAVEHERTVFMIGAATGVLDAALARRRLPRFCHSPASPSRTALQVLPLAFATRWAPFDPFALMELLLLPQGPVPRSVSASLAKALSEAPGRGSAAWTGALDEATRRRRTKFERDGLAGGTLTGRLREDTDRWGAWVRATVHDPSVGMPADEARRVCGMVAGWAARSGPADPLRMQAAAIASELSAAIEQLGESFLPRALLSRMIDEAVGPGVPDPAAEAEACTWSAVHSPGAFWATADTVVWWAPSGAVTPRSGPWTLAEVEELAGSECRVRNGAMSVAAASRAWRQPIMHAARQVVLVVSKTLDGRVPDEHPLMHELRSVLRDARGVVLRAEDLLRGASDFGGRQCARTLTEVRLLPVPSRMWPAMAAVAAPTVASATSLEKLLGCRLAWTLEYAASIRRGSRASIPMGDRLIGQLAHAVARDVMLPGEPPKSRAAQERARVTLEGLLASEAAPLLMPGNAADLARARRLVPEALGHLSRVLGEAGLRIIGTELAVAADQGDLPLGAAVLSGRIDLLAETEHGARVVVDLKWAGREKYRVAEVEEGRAVQLATYARLQPRGIQATAAYYMLAQARFIAADSWPFEGARVGCHSLEETWRELSAGWAAALASLASGSIDAPAIGEEPVAHPSGLQVPPPCTFCHYGALCGHKELT